MPIAVTCPHCQTRYPKIPDSFAGKTVKCKTEDCRQDFLVPVPLSAAIPEGPMPSVLSYGSLCGQAFALSSSALYRLSLETPPLGTWKRVPLDSAFPGLDAFGPHWSAVTHQSRVGNEEQFYLFSNTGLVVELKATCP